MLQYVPWVFLGVTLGTAIYYAVSALYTEQPTSHTHQRPRKQTKRPSNDCCPACLEPFIRSYLCFACSHKMHIECYTELRKYSSQCPMCRQYMKVESEH